MNLGGAHLVLDGETWPVDVCPHVAVGDVYTLVATTGSLRGQFAGLANGSTLTLQCARAVQPTLRVNYTASSVTATVVTTSQYPTATLLTATPSSATTNQNVTLTAQLTPRSWVPVYGLPAGTVSFMNGDRVIPGCATQPVGVVEETRLVGMLPYWEALCHTSFVATGSFQLTAEFTPADPSTWQASTSVSEPFSVFSETTTTSPQAPASTRPTTPGAPALPVGSPRLDASNVTLSGLASDTPSLSFKLNTGLKRTRIRSVEVTLPPGFSFSTNWNKLISGISIHGRTKHTVELRGQKLTVTFQSSGDSIWLRVGRSTLLESSESRFVRAMSNAAPRGFR